MQRGANLYIPEEIHRIGSSSVDPTAKNYHWGDFTQGLLEAKNKDFDNTVPVSYTHLTLPTICSV